MVVNLRNIFKRSKALCFDISNFVLKVVSIKKRKMNISDLVLPSTVKNMTILQKDAFTKIVKVPSIKINLKYFDQILKKSKPYMLKLRRFNSILIPEDSKETRQIILNPVSIKCEKDIQIIIGIDLNEIDGKFAVVEVTVHYDNWKAHHILEAILPDHASGCSGFTVVGHILQLNLREHLLPYRKLIAQVYLDKTPNVSLVVNKTDIIDNSDNTFRSFSMEKLAGETENTVATVKENGCLFTFDFAKVYWNSRLCTEHERIVKKLKREDILFDVMAGVGPFAIPAAKRNCQVYANDLNPLSYEALLNNCRINKVTENVCCYQMDGKDFITNIFKEKYLDILKQKEFRGSVHVTMNLPSIAIEFLPSFIDLYKRNDFSTFSTEENMESRLPVIHVYLFSYNETEEFALYLVASKLGFCLKQFVLADQKDISKEHLIDSICPSFKKHVIEIKYVRRVAPAKVMFRVTFHFPKEKLLISEGSQSAKKLKIY